MTTQLQQPAEISSAAESPRVLVVLAAIAAALTGWYLYQLLASGLLLSVPLIAALFSAAPPESAPAWTGYGYGIALGFGGILGFHLLRIVLCTALALGFAITAWRNRSRRP